MSTRPLTLYALLITEEGSYKTLEVKPGLIPYETISESVGGDLALLAGATQDPFVVIYYREDLEATNAHPTLALPNINQFICGNVFVCSHMGDKEVGMSMYQVRRFLSEVIIMR